MTADREAVAIAFGKVLREARQAAGMSQEDLADAANMSRDYPSSLERGVRTPTLHMLFRIAKALNLQPWKLVLRTASRL